MRPPGGLDQHSHAPDGGDGPAAGSPGHGGAAGTKAKGAGQATPDFALLARITRRAFVHMVTMIHRANHRDDVREGDPKVGGHPAACASSLEILAALHLLVREPGDYVCCKPHASPVDHALHHQLGLFRHPDGRWFTEAEGEAVMHRLRSFSRDGAPVFQSYHAEADPDSFRFLPSGSVGIPPVVSVYLALAYRYAHSHGWTLPQPHFWSLMGDSEFREGSLMEVLPEVAERELGNVCWIVDYNRQNLDGTRIPNKRGLKGTDADRIQRTCEANGWQVIQVRHGSYRESLFKRPGGDALRDALEHGFSDYRFQTLLWKREAQATRDALLELAPKCGPLVESLPDADVLRLVADLGGHDLRVLEAALRASKLDDHTPTLIVAHTVKGRGLECFAAPGNHSALPEDDEVLALLASEGLAAGRPFARFAAGSPEARYLAERGERFRGAFERLDAEKGQNLAKVRSAIQDAGGVPDSLEINLKLAPVAHTQWMWGQLAAKLVRIGVFDELQHAGKAAGKQLAGTELRWNAVADLVLTMAPDVGTSTNINPAMDQKVFGPESERNWEEELELRERLRPELAPTDEAWTRHIRFEIAEANCMSALGSFGKFGQLVGIPLLPMMTVYDFFIKRALDQLYYDLYWGSSFVLVGTPSGVALSPEGAQHSWKSDLQVPNLITWEPAFAIEMDWILCDAIRRHLVADNEGRTGVLVRAVTLGIRQAMLLESLRRHRRFKKEAPPGAELGLVAADGGLLESSLEALPDGEILRATRDDALQGAYRLVDWRGYRGYEPGENVVHLFVMGVLVKEAVLASLALLDTGICADVFVVTSPELLLGSLGERSGHRHLRETLGIRGEPQAGGRVPIVSVHDGEAGLLDNLGSAAGTRQWALAVRKFSKSGTPVDVFAYHHIDAAGIAETCERALEETAEEGAREPGGGDALHDAT